MTWFEVAALLLSPLIALWVNGWLQERQRKFLAKVWVLQTLNSNRYSVNEDRTRAYNSIDLLFYDKPVVRGLWHELFEMYSNTSYTDPEGAKKRIAKDSELIYEMAKALGYGEAISKDDAARVYLPTGLTQPLELGKALITEMTRVFKAMPTPDPATAPAVAQQQAPSTAIPSVPTQAEPQTLPPAKA